MGQMNNDDILRERKRLARIFAKMDENKRKVLDGVFDTAAFLRVQLKCLQQSIIADGHTDEYRNGENQSGTKESPAAKLHLSVTKNYTAVMKLLTDNVPPAERKKVRFALANDGDDTAE